MARARRAARPTPRARRNRRSGSRARRPNAPRHPMGEIRAVDDDQRVGRSRNHQIRGVANAPQDERQPPRDRGKSDDRELVDGKRAGEPLRRHGAAADPGEAHRRRCAPEGPHQRRAELITGFLARDQNDRQVFARPGRIVHPSVIARRDRPIPMMNIPGRGLRGALGLGHDALPATRQCRPARHGRRSDGPRPDRGQIDPAVLPGFRCLDQHADAERAGCGRVAATVQHGPASRRCLPRLPPRGRARRRRWRPVPHRTARARISAARARYRVVALGRTMAAENSLGDQDFRRNMLDADHPEPAALEKIRDPGQEMIVAAAKKRISRGINRTVSQSRRNCVIGGRSSVPMNTTSRQFSPRARRKNVPPAPARSSDSRISR